jgi:hypothetical protein
MQLLLSAALFSVSCIAFADCQTSLPLEGAISIKTCDPRTETCISGEKAVYDYMGNVKDDPSVLTIALNASPWRFYDSEMRIITIEELAQMAQSKISKEVKRIDLIASWTGVSPQHGGKSLARKLSDSLKGFPVSGKDGFLWIAKDGHLRTTHQAFTLRKGGNPYNIADGDEVMISLAAGWLAPLEEVLVKEQNADGLMRAGAGWDIFFLCPDRALQAFDAAAKLKHPIAAYNAALMRLDRRNSGDLEAATALLSQAADAGDKKAQVLLNNLAQAGRETSVRKR